MRNCKSVFLALAMLAALTVSAQTTPGMQWAETIGKLTADRAQREQQQSAKQSREAAPDLYRPPVVIQAPISSPPVNQETAGMLKTAGLLNGRFWATVDSAGKLCFVAGFVEALGAAGVADTTQDRYYSGAMLGEVVKGLDRFYEDPANAAIPATAALEVFASKVKGASPEDLAAEVAILRGLSASAHGTAWPDDINATGTAGGEAGSIDLKDLGATPVNVQKSNAQR